LRIAPKVNG